MIATQLLSCHINYKNCCYRIKQLNFQLEDIMKNISGYQIPRQRRESLTEAPSNIRPSDVYSTRNSIDRANVPGTIAISETET